jgi:hypothetical protein
MKSEVFALACATLFAIDAGSCSKGPEAPSEPAATIIDDLVGAWSATIVTPTDSCLSVHLELAV